MDLVLSGLQWSHYLDDIIMLGTAFKEGNIQIVLQRLSEAGLKLNPSKKVHYLGHKRGNSPRFVQDYDLAHAHLNGSVQQFLGLAGYYCHFIKDFSNIAKPLHFTSLFEPLTANSSFKICTSSFHKHQS